MEFHLCSLAVKHLVRQRTDTYSELFGRTVVRGRFSEGPVALTGRNSGLWYKLGQTGRGILGRSSSQLVSLSLSLFKFLNNLYNRSKVGREAGGGRGKQAPC